MGGLGYHGDDNYSSKIENERIVKDLVEEAIFNAKREYAAMVIGKRWLSLYYDPNSDVCRRRMMRQFEELKDSINTVHSKQKSL